MCWYKTQFLNLFTGITVLLYTEVLNPWVGAFDCSLSCCTWCLVFQVLKLYKLEPLLRCGFVPACLQHGLSQSGDSGYLCFTQWSLNTPGVSRMTEVIKRWSWSQSLVLELQDVFSPGFFITNRFQTCEGFTFELITSGFSCKFVIYINLK